MVREARDTYRGGHTVTQQFGDFRTFSLRAQILRACPAGKHRSKLGSTRRLASQLFGPHLELLKLHDGRWKRACDDARRCEEAL